jgi:hypothetical protein
MGRFAISSSVIAPSLSASQRPNTSAAWGVRPFISRGWKAASNSANVILPSASASKDAKLGRPPGGGGGGVSAAGGGASAGAGASSSAFAEVIIRDIVNSDANVSVRVFTFSPFRLMPNAGIAGT